MRRSVGPIRATASAAYGLLLAFPITLFTFALVTDIAYLRTQELQWSNVSAWSIAGGVAFGAAALVFAVLGLLMAFRTPRRGARLLHILALAVMCTLGLINAFKHSQDGWSAVGALGVSLSVVTALAALTAGAIAYAGLFDEEAA